MAVLAGCAFATVDDNNGARSGGNNTGPVCRAPNHSPSDSLGFWDKLHPAHVMWVIALIFLIIIGIAGLVSEVTFSNLVSAMVGVIAGWTARPNGNGK
jgi:hypothetical protein